MWHSMKYHGDIECETTQTLRLELWKSNIWDTNKASLYGLLWCLSGKESICSAREAGLILGSEDPLEKGMATHSSILAWEIPWTEKLCGLWAMGSQKSWTRLFLATKQRCISLPINAQHMYICSIVYDI